MIKKITSGYVFMMDLEMYNGHQESNQLWLYQQQKQNL